MSHGTVILSLLCPSSSQLQVDKHYTTLDTFFKWQHEFLTFSCKVVYQTFRSVASMLLVSWSVVSLLSVLRRIVYTTVQDIETLFACKVGFSGSANSNMLSEFSREEGSCHGNQI